MSCRDYRNKTVANGTFFKSAGCKICLCSKGSGILCSASPCPIPATCDDLIRKTDCCNFGCIIGPTTHSKVALEANSTRQGTKFGATALTVSIIASLFILMLMRLKKRQTTLNSPCEWTLISCSLSRTPDERLMDSGQHVIIDTLDQTDLTPCLTQGRRDSFGSESTSFDLQAILDFHLNPAGNASIPGAPPDYKKVEDSPPPMHEADPPSYREACENPPEPIGTADADPPPPYSVEDHGRSSDALV